MIIRINLLSPEEIKKAEHPEIFLLIGLVAVLIILAGLFNYVVKVSSLHSAQQELFLLETEKRRYQDLVNQLNSIQQSRDALQQKKNIINSLLDLRFVYPRFMENILRIIPTGVWLTNLNTTWGPGQISFTTAANAQDIYAIAEIVSNLEKDNSFSAINLGTINQAGSGKDIFYTFQLSGTLAATKPSSGATQ